MATDTIAPAVNIGWATFNGKRANADAYSKKAIPYRPKPSQNGQLLKAVIGSTIDGNFRSGIIAILTNTLAEALAPMPKSKMSHFINDLYQNYTF